MSTMSVTSRIQGANRPGQSVANVASGVRSGAAAGRHWRRKAGEPLTRDTGTHGLRYPTCHDPASLYSRVFLRLSFTLTR